jgi:hypothetical protein
MKKGPFSPEDRRMLRTLRAAEKRLLASFCRADRGKLETLQRLRHRVFDFEYQAQRDQRVTDAFHWLADLDLKKAGGL